MTTIGIFAALLIVLFLLRRVYAKSCLENLDVQLSMSANTATEGDTLVLTETIINRKWLPLPWLAVKFQVDRELDFADRSAAAVSDLYYRNDLFHIMMHQKITRRLAFICTKRGYYSIRGLEIAGWDVLMENKYIRQYPSDARLTVYPRTLSACETDELCTRIYGHLRTRHPIHPDPFSFRGIREYSHSDPMKIINFKASAKAQGLMVNVWDFANTRQIVLVLDVQRYTAWHSEELEERAIKIVATLAERMTSQGVPIAFAANAIVKPPRGDTPAKARIPEGCGAKHLRIILEALAFIDLSADVQPVSDILDGMTREGRLEPEYWLISPYYSKDTDAALLRLRETGARTAWIMPEPKPIDADFGDKILFI